MEDGLLEELQFHLQNETKKNVAAGQTTEEARYAALRSFGGVERVKEQCRDTRKLRLVEVLWQDVRYGVRMLARNLGFASVAIVTLALGIGASMAILTVVKSVLLRSLPFPDADRVVVLFATSPARGVYRDTTSFPDFLDWKEQSHSFSAVAAWRRYPFNVTGGGAPEPIVGLGASHELFSVLSVSPALGRSFDKEEQQGKNSVALISHGLWMRRFGGDVDVLGKSIVLNDVPHSVIGVLPQGFQFPSFTDTDVIVPIPEYVEPLSWLPPWSRPAKIWGAASDSAAGA